MLTINNNKMYKYKYAYGVRSMDAVDAAHLQNFKTLRVLLYRIILKFRLILFCFALFIYFLLYGMYAILILYFKLSKNQNNS